MDDSSPALSVLSSVHAAIAHDSAAKHVSGEALYIDDLPEPAGLLHIHVGQSAARPRPGHPPRPRPPSAPRPAWSAS